ncbi:MAG: hypothetical protein ACLP1X_28585 [Polyangiaceae bacterium]|jgi:hypothetical protein
MIATTVLAAQYAGTLDLSDTTKVDARATSPPPIIEAPRLEKVVLAMDVSTIPTVRIRLLDRQLEYTLSYTPTLTAFDLEVGLSPLVLHTGFGTVAWHNRTIRVTLSEAGAYGQLNSALLYQQPTVPGQPTAVVQSAPAPTTIDFASSNTEASVSLRSGRSTTIVVSGGYMLSGGTSAFAQTVLPQQQGPRGSASVAYALSRIDNLTTLVSVQDATTSGECPPLTTAAPALPPSRQFSDAVNAAIDEAVQSPLCVTRAGVAQVTETLRHRFSSTLSLSLGVGASAALVQAPAAGEELVIQPVGTVTLLDGLGRNDTRTLTVSANVTPFVDIRTGLVDDRAGATATLVEQVAPTITLRCTASALQSIPFPTIYPYPITLFTGGVEARNRLDRQLDFALGVQTLWQNQTGYGTLASTIGYVSVTARAPTLHF